ncbi:MAG: sensor histidine kinase KdpD [Actinomycetota bacterium]|nr:sensor histidine kinase KdpD [Actinomycetota bacterium]
MARGHLRIYLGAAPGVGKTYAMLEEAHRRQSRGTDVVVAVVETHGRQHTAAMLAGLETVPRTPLTYRGTVFQEMDLDAVLARRPQVAVVDELAHTNVPGSRHTKRWQDIEQLLDAGITVLSTVNIQHLESLNDVVEQITGAAQRETVPDRFVRQAEQVELVDMTPEALRRRMAHGNVYAPDKVSAALGNYFRVGNLTALRELALLWLADKVDEQLDTYRADHGIGSTWEARERVVVALTGGPEGETLIRRAARIAARTKGAELMAIHVARSDGLTGADPARLARQRVLMESLGGTYHQVTGDDIPTALLDFARGVNATQLVLGASRRGRFAQILSAGVGVTTTALSGPIDVHLVTHAEIARRLPAARSSPLSRRRRLAGFTLALLGLPVLTLTLRVLRDELSLASDVLVTLAAVVAVALLGGMWPAVTAAVIGFLLLNFFFTEPYHTFDIADRDNLIALLVFLLVAVPVAVVVDLAARRTRQAAEASTEATTLATVAGSVLRGTRPLTALLERLRETFQLNSVTLLERPPGTPGGRQDDPAAWHIAAAVGNPPCEAPADGDTTVPVDDDLTLALHGRSLAAADQRIVEAFAAQAAIALRQERLAEQAARARPLEEADKLRTALLAAVSHDLRTPLASAMAAVESLRSPDIHFSDDDQRELLDSAAESHQRLHRLIENLLDMSRLQAGALGVTLTAVGLEDAVPAALDEISGEACAVTVAIPDDLPTVNADAGLLQRVLVNLTRNALRYSPPDRPPLITAADAGDRIELSVIDHGPGIPGDQRNRVFQPFQRLGDRSNDTGTGLGLALSRGLTEAMGGTLTLHTTPGGGVTMKLTLPATASPPTTADETRAGELTDRAAVERLRRRSPAAKETP